MIRTKKEALQHGELRESKGTFAASVNNLPEVGPAVPGEMWLSAARDHASSSMGDPAVLGSCSAAKSKPPEMPGKLSSEANPSCPWKLFGSESQKTSELPGGPRFRMTAEIPPGVITKLIGLRRSFGILGNAVAQLGGLSKIDLKSGEARSLFFSTPRAFMRRRGLQSARMSPAFARCHTHGEERQKRHSGREAG